MKTAISIPNKLFEAAEDMARRFKWSRSELYANAVREFVHKHQQDSITERLNEIYDEEACSLDDQLRHMQEQSIDKEQW